MNKKIRINKYCGILFIILMLELDCFGFINRYNVYLMGVSYSDCVFIIKLSVILISILQNQRIFQKRRIIFNILPLGALFLVITSAFAGNVTWKQPIILGILAQREWISCILMYYPLKIWIEKRKLNFEKIFKTILFVGSLYLAICIIQYLFVNHIIFLNITSINERYGDARLRFNPVLPIVCSAFCLDGIFSNNTPIKRKVYYEIFILATLFFVTTVTKGRMRTLSLLLGLIFCLLIKKIDKRKKFFSIGLIVLGVLVLSTSQMGQDIIDIFWGSGAGIDADTLSIRDAESSYYLNLISESIERIFLGCGYPSVSWQIAVSMSSPTIGSWSYYTTDIGIIGNIFHYGILGLLWLLCIYMKIVFKGNKIYRGTGQTVFLQIVIVDLISCVTLIPLLFSSSIIFTLIFIMMEMTYEKMQPNLY